MENLNAALRTPSPADLAKLWQNVHIIPMMSERDHHRAQVLYEHLGLDWRTPEHRSHVMAIVAKYGGERRSSFKVRETND